MFIIKGVYVSIWLKFGPNTEIDLTTAGLKTLNPLFTAGMQVVDHHDMGAPMIGSIPLAGYLVNGGERRFDRDFVAQWWNIKILPDLGINKIFVIRWSSSLRRDKEESVQWQHNEWTMKNEKTLAELGSLVI